MEFNTMRLITIPMSHYCEKARWGLAHAGIDYVEEAHLQVFHYAAISAYNNTGMVPVLVTDNGAISDSTAILQFLDQQLAPARKLYPEPHRAEIEALEENLDTNFGIETRRWVYFHWMGLPRRDVMRTAGQGTPGWQRFLAPMLFPMMRRYLSKHLEISASNVERGMQEIQSAFDAVADRLRDGRPFLFGDQFTAADLTFASLAAPILLPPEYGIRLPTLDEAPAAARTDIDKFRAHSAGQFALQLFRNHRQRMS